jgi:16S rRNA (guanine966-N2)-methyltransferase
MSLRVIAGEAKGHIIKVPEKTGTRPATDLVRGAIFSMLENLTDEWSRVLDLYSGSGAMGIEALSRGAGWADFIDRQERCCAIIKQNLEKTKLSDRAHVYCTGVERALSFLDKEYDIIIMDPPYADATIGAVITRLAGSKLVVAHTVVVVTHSPRLKLETDYDSLTMIKERRHGDSVIAIYNKRV